MTWCLAPSELRGIDRYLTEESVDRQRLLDYQEELEDDYEQWEWELSQEVSWELGRDNSPCPNETIID